MIQPSCGESQDHSKIRRNETHQAGRIDVGLEVIIDVVLLVLDLLWGQYHHGVSSDGPAIGSFESQSMGIHDSSDRQRWKRRLGMKLSFSLFLGIFKSRQCQGLQHLLGGVTVSFSS